MKLSRRQIYLFLACVAPIGKLVVLPTELVREAKNDLLLPVAIHFLVQAAVIFCVLLLGRRERGLYEILEGTFGRVFAKICMVTLSLFLLLAGLVPLIEQQLFVQGVFYDTLPSVIAYAPFFVFAAYLASKPLAHMGRVWDILAPLFAVGLLGILLLSVGSADYAALLPIGASGTGFLKSTLSASVWFFDAPLLLLLLGKFEYREGMAWKGALCYLGGGLAVLFFLATFYGIFEETAINQIFAFSKTAKYFSGITVLGRIDYIFVYALALVLAFYTVLPAQCAIDGVVQAFGSPRHLQTILSAGIFLGYFVLSLVFDYSFFALLKFMTKALVYLFPVFATLIPALLLTLGRQP